METEPLKPTDKVGSGSCIRAFFPEVALALGLATMAVIVVHMIYHDSFVDSSTYSNRSFALPGAGFSLLFVVYGSIRAAFLPFWLRLIGAPFVFFAGYLGIGFLLILINAAI